MEPPMEPPAGPTIIVISLGEQWMQDMVDRQKGKVGVALNALSSFAHLLIAHDIDGAIEQINERVSCMCPPHGVLVIDGGLTQPGSKKLLDRVVAYARAGGTVVMSYFFSTHTQMDAMKDFWNEGWGLPWKPGSILRGRFALNDSASTLGGAKEQLGEVPVYCQKALSLMNVEREHSRRAPLKCPLENPVHEDEAVMAFAPVGQGFVGYTGDLHFVLGSHMATLGMFGFLTDSSGKEEAADDVSHDKGESSEKGKGVDKGKNVDKGKSFDKGKSIAKTDSDDSDGEYSTSEDDRLVDVMRRKRT